MTQAETILEIANKILKAKDEDLSQIEFLCDDLKGLVREIKHLEMFVKRKMEQGINSWNRGFDRYENKDYQSAANSYYEAMKCFNECADDLFLSM